MSANSTIEWTTHTFNPWIGCTKVSAGCANCYAEQLMDKRWGKVQWGPRGDRKRTSAGNWREPFNWHDAAAKAGRRDRVFCASLSDVFEDRPELEPWRDELFTNVIEPTGHLDWQLLTKRPENVMGMVPLPWTQGQWPKNVWLGTSCEDQQAADERIPHLLRCPAPVRFLSCEPLIGPVDITSAVAKRRLGDPQPNWVIVGGESGPGARPCAIEWIRSIVQQCGAAGVACFVKQLGAGPMHRVALPRGDDPRSGVEPFPVSNRKGSELSDFPEDLRVRQMPEAHTQPQEVE